MVRFRVEPLEPLGLTEVDPSASVLAPKDVYFCLDTEDGRVWFEWRCQCEQAVDFRVWHGIVRRWEVPVYADAKAMTEAINGGALDAMLERILAGASIIWDGNNHVCRMTKDAQDADDEVRQWFDGWKDSLECGLWDAGDWFGDWPPEEVTASSTDEELDAVAEKWEAKAREDNVVLIRTREYLDELRNQLRKEAETKNEEDD